MLPPRSNTLLTVVFVAAATACDALDAPVRAPAVQGQFYPDDAGRLRGAVERFLAAAPKPPPEMPIAIVAPHAGYIYSGQTCADAFRRAQGHDYDLVVILGTNHTVPSFQGVALYPAGSFRTPLGDAAIDDGAVDELCAAESRFAKATRPHLREHSVEVMIPFVQCLFPKAKIVPGIVGSPDLDLCVACGRAMAKVIQKRKALIVASSDLSHYPPYESAGESDRRTLAAIASLEPPRLRSVVEAQEQRGVPQLSTCACGEGPILVTMACAKALGATHAAVVSYANSGDTLVGELDRVVGYGAVAFYAGSGESDLSGIASAPRPAAAAALSAEEKKALLAFARESIARMLDTDTVPLPRGFGAAALANRGAFVTLKKKDGELRGCIGHIPADTPLARTVGKMALQAAFNDRRFSPVRSEELGDIEVEVSVLTAPERVAGPEDIVVGRDGVILAKSGRSAVFLPQVATEQGWSREEMLRHLALKAGLPQDAWKDGATFSTFQAEVFKDGGPRAAR